MYIRRDTRGDSKEIYQCNMLERYPLYRASVDHWYRDHSGQWLDYSHYNYMTLPPHMYHYYYTLLFHSFGQQVYKYFLMNRNTDLLHIMAQLEAEERHIYFARNSTESPQGNKHQFVQELKRLLKVENSSQSDRPFSISSLGGIL